MEELLALSLSRVGFLKARERYVLAKLFGDTAALVRSRKRQVQEALGRRVLSDWEPEALVHETQRRIGAWRSQGFGWTIRGAEGYPYRLAQIYDPPLVLFSRGRLPDFRRPTIAGVGTRLPREDCREAAFQFGRAAAAAGMLLVSGLAYGVDSAVHTGGLAAGGLCVAVLGSGVGSVQPAGNRRLARDILQRGGVLLSEYPPDEGAAKFRFIERNRIISGLSQAVAIIDAPPGSGALYTVDFALEQGRDVLVHRLGAEGSERGLALRELLDTGAIGVPYEADAVSAFLESAYAGT